jgi:DNA-binding beta-propeller fold protein YncE
MRHRILKTVIALALAGGASLAALAQQTTFHVTRTITLGGDGSWDYLHFDPDANRLFIARSTRVMVVDLAAGKLVGEIPDTAGVHGVAMAQAQGRGVTSNGKANTASIFDLLTLKVLANVQTGEKPDGILWEPFTKTVPTMYGASNSITMIDVGAEKVVAAIPLPGQPESAVSDGKGRVFVNLEDKAQIAEVDMRSRSVMRTWKLAGCTGPTGLVIDKVDARVFFGMPQRRADRGRCGVGPEHPEAAHRARRGRGGVRREPAPGVHLE